VGMIGCTRSLSQRVQERGEKRNVSAIAMNRMTARPPRDIPNLLLLRFKGMCSWSEEFSPIDQPVVMLSEAKHLNFGILRPALRDSG